LKNVYHELIFLKFFMSKRILSVTRNFPPLTGGMERLNYHIYLELEKEFEVSISGPEGCQHYLSPHTSYSLFPSRPVGIFLLRSLISAYQLAVKEKPDLIIAGSGVTAIAALIAGRRVGAKVMTFLHGLDILYPNPLYQLLFLPFIRACDGVWVNSTHTAQLAKKKGIADEKINILHPGVILPSRNETAINPVSFRQSFSISDNKIILLSVGRLTERKGLPEFIQNCLAELVSAFPEILLVIIGNEPTEALSKQSGVTSKIKQAGLASGTTEHIMLLGQVSESELSQAYVCSDLLVFPVLDLPGDVEGFGMVAIEAAAHGLPTAAFAVGGITDAVAHNTSGWLVESGNYANLNKTIINYLNYIKELQPLKVNSISKVTCQQYAAKFSWDLFGQQLRLTCKQITISENLSKT
jgi:phosphatidyl-myo-inositol dimannoside synthase